MEEPTRPRPTPGSGSRSASPSASRPAIEGAPARRPSPTPSAPTTTGADGANAATTSARGQLTRVEVQPSQVVAAAGSAIVTAARVGRLLGRSGWRIARQLPGARTVEREAQRLQTVAINEARRILQIPQALPGMGNRPVSPEEQRAVDYVRATDPGDAPLRSAMSELLERSVEATRTDSRDYLYGTIISQLVPDEARIVAALSGGAHFAAADVVQKQRRGRPRVLLANASAIGRQAGLTTPDNTPTYLTRLHGFGLVEFGPEDESLSVQYDILAADSAVRAAREGVEARRRGSVKVVRKVVQLSAFGVQFWTATDPSRPPFTS